MKISKASKTSRSTPVYLFLGALVACAAGVYMVNTIPSTPMIMNSHKAFKAEVEAGVRAKATADSKKIVEEAVKNFADVTTFIDELMKAIVALAPGYGFDEVSAEAQAEFRAELVTAFDETAKSEFFGDEATYVSRFKELIQKGSPGQIKKPIRKFFNPVKFIVRILRARGLKGEKEKDTKAKNNTKKIKKMITGISKISFGKRIKFKAKTVAL